jgi:NAD(P)-dependent dehydrogenase (short-subunit alcohol dehydrogenase family)
VPRGIIHARNAYGRFQGTASWNALTREGNVSAEVRTAVVTGAGSGIGRHVATGLLDQGYRVALAGRRPGPLEALASDSPGKALAVPTDITDPASVRGLFEMVAREFGRLDLLFNNAGVGLPATPIEDLTLEQWQAVVDVNLTGAFLCAREAFRLMKKQEQGGRIINNGSISAQVPRPHSIAYTVTKHGITGLTRALALDGRSLGIACGQIDIGNADTQMTGSMNEGVLQADGSVRPEPTIPVSKVAEAVLYMAGLPHDANVLFMTVMATQMPFVGRG